MINLYSYTLKFLDFKILIKSNYNNTLTWLREFMLPSFEVSSCDQKHDIEIEHIIDSVRYNEYRNSLPVNCKSIVNVFAMDNKKLRLPLYDIDNETLLYDESTNVIYILPEKSPILIISPEDNIYSRKALMRTVRELATNYCREKNDLIIHGAALAFNDRGIIIAGPKGAGKTTLLISLLHNKSYSYIANDRLVINSDNNQYSIIGIPTIINIGKDTLSSFENFEGSVSKENSKYYLNMDEKNLVSDKISKTDPNGNYTLSPLHLCNLLKIEMLNKSKLSLIIFINAKKTGKRLTIEELSSGHAAEKLYQNNFRLESEDNHLTFFNLSDNNIPINKGNILALCTDITSDVQCIECRLNLNRLDHEYIHHELYNRLLDK